MSFFEECQENLTIPPSRTVYRAGFVRGLPLRAYWYPHSASGLEPGDDLRPDSREGLASHQDPEVLQGNADFTRIGDDPCIACRHRVDEGPHRNHRGDLVSRVHHSEHRSRKARGADMRSVDRELPTAKEVFAVKPFNDLMKQLARQGNLVQSPALHTGVNIDGMGVGGAIDGVHHARPYERVRRRERA